MALSWRFVNPQPYITLEAVTDTDEERCILCRSLLNSVPEGVNYPDVCTHTQVELAVLERCGGIQAHIETAKLLRLKGIFTCTR